MTLRTKLMILICLVFAAAIVIMFFISQAIIMGRFEDLEKQNTSQNVQRAASALYTDFSTISIEFSSLMVESECFSVVQDGNDIYMTCPPPDGGEFWQTGSIVHGNIKGNQIFVISHVPDDGKTCKGIATRK